MKNLVLTFLATGGIQIANLATGIIAARILLPDGRGELALLALWPILICDLGSLSINAAVSFYSARFKDRMKAIWSSSVILAGLLSPLLIGVYAAAVPYLYGDHRPEVIELAWLCALRIPLHLFTLVLISQFQGMEEFSAFNLLQLMFHFSYLGCILLLLLSAGPSLEAFGYSLIVANAISLATALYLTWRRGWISFVPAMDMLRYLVSYGARNHVSVVLGLINRRLDQAIISVALAVTDLGLYVVAMTVESLLFLMASTVDLLLFPKIAAQQTEEGRQAVLGRYFRVTIVLVVPPTVFLLIFVPELIELVFGAAFLPAVDAARILILTGIPYAVKTMLSTYMRASNRMRIITKGEGVGIVATVVALAVLLPPFGLMGAAVAQVLAFTCPAIYIAYHVRRETNLSLLNLFRFHKRDIEVLEELLARISRRRDSR